MQRIIIPDSSPHTTSKISVGDEIDYKDDVFICFYIVSHNGSFIVYSASVRTEKFCFLKQTQVGDSYQTMAIVDKEDQQLALDLFHERREEDDI